MADFLIAVLATTSRGISDSDISTLCSKLGMTSALIADALSRAQQALEYLQRYKTSRDPQMPLPRWAVRLNKNGSEFPMSREVSLQLDPKRWSIVKDSPGIPYKLVPYVCFCPLCGMQNTDFQQRLVDSQRAGELQAYALLVGENGQH
ncbi:uncharacterized protein Z519_09493 [Cladophialophora bantiana CBS 173.52]|uniref:Uncharacterized protein n=1 Tax=Cladophialophora bantiana (strain ATCC 10958 / CBS 173.52 / CDC B-1940 / NIH 8579) TaxID=1442370 RepID=A0A0D2FU52_CLAB1|nr:uncharacterized protein Z519_09493 [Cladophialophora bantiana CBS 173.52]KIW90062.1 hypothetical protein Z519_09493 [Cladophialophora bantiana CBS 173.52]